MLFPNFYYLCPLYNVSMEQTPRHVAIIMDGNGRWAHSKGLERSDGHKRGVESLRSVVEAAVECGVEYLTVYAFSTENWGRPQSEVSGIMELLSLTIAAQADDLAKNGVRLSFIGDISALSSTLQNTITQASNVYIETVNMNLVVALNYSSRWDIVKAVNEIAQSGCIEIDEKRIKQHLSTSTMPDVDFLIRTSGEQRLSNFLLWELSYAELHFTETLWPDFKGDEFRQALQLYATRNRRYGKL